MSEMGLDEAGWRGGRYRVFGRSLCGMIQDLV